MTEDYQKLLKIFIFNFVPLWLSLSPELALMKPWRQRALAIYLDGVVPQQIPLRHG